MSIPKALQRRAAVEARLSARFRAQARMLARYCEHARARGFDNCAEAVQVIETSEAYAVALERWCLGEITPQELAVRYGKVGVAPARTLSYIADALQTCREHLCKCPTHAPPWWEFTSLSIEWGMLDCARWVTLGEGSRESVLGEYATTLRAVEREDVERASAAKLPIERLATTTKTAKGTNP